MPVRYSWSDVVSTSNLAFIASTPLKRKHLEEMYDALAKYRAAYKYSDMSLIGWWWRSGSTANPGTNRYAFNRWTRSGSGSMSVPSSNVLQLKPTSTSTYFESALLNTYPPAKAYPTIGGSNHRYLVIKIRSTVALTNFQIRWTTTSATGTWRSQVLPSVPSNNQWVTLEFDLGTHTNWTGSLRQLRLALGVSSGTIEIEYLLIDKEDLRLSTLQGTNLPRQTEITKARTLAARANGSAGSSASVSWTDAIVTAGVTPIKAIHYKEIRDQINAAYGKNRGWSTSTCDGYNCVCNYGCDGYSSGDCDCDDSCYSDSCNCNGSYSICPEDYWSGSGSCRDDSVCICDGSCDRHSCYCDESCNSYSPDSCPCEGVDFVECYTCYSYTAGI